ncbi:DsbA family protein [Novosphingobium sp. 9]|uniref:DsbA family protein n=1 Tax=Novosphingobium sp. 9 TaxID=2025349 RepID=UPI0021B6DA1F|nr:DsbA family protein [Novosphingobium sp. 9]
MFKHTAALVGLSAALLIGTAGSTALSAAAPKKAAVSAGRNWSLVESANPDGTITVGNPNAPVKMTEYVSYTCPHCAEFHKDSTAALQQSAIPKGQIQVTVSSLLRNPIDLAVSLLVACGDPRQMWTRHNAFMATQDVWIAKAEMFTRDQQQRWFTGAVPDRMKAITTDFGFYATVKPWGISQAQADQCLSSKAAIDKLMGLQKVAEQVGVPGTPSFVIDGKLAEEHDWPTLQKDLLGRIAAHRSSMS